MKIINKLLDILALHNKYCMSMDPLIYKESAGCPSKKYLIFHLPSQTDFVKHTVNKKCGLVAGNLIKGEINLSGYFGIEKGYYFF